MAGQTATENRRSHHIHRRILVSLAVITPLGFALKLYAGPGHRWLNNSVAGALYEVFWCLVVFFIWPRRRYATRIALGVFVATSLLEILQLWHPWLLEQVRAGFLGRALIGTTFSWTDFPYYVLGCLLGWLWMRAISKLPTEDEPLPETPGQVENSGAEWSDPRT